MWRLVALGSVVLAIAGVSVLLPPSDGEEQLRSLTHIATNGTDDASPASAAIKPLEASQTTPKAGQRATAQASSEALAVAAAGPALPDGVDPEGKIVVQIQEQLRRVGCFKGKLQGHWDAATRRAMARFNVRVNAHFALDTPSPVLLTLVEKYDNRACGTPCSPGTSPNFSGQCTSTQVVTAALPLPLQASPAQAVVAGAAPGVRHPVPGTLSAPLVAATTAADIAKPAPVKVVNTSVPAASPPKAVVASGGNDWAPTVVIAPAAAALVARPSVVAAVPKPGVPAPEAKQPPSVVAAAQPRKPTLPGPIGTASSVTSQPVVLALAPKTLELKSSNALLTAPVASELPAAPVEIAMATPTAGVVDFDTAKPRKTTIVVVATKKKKYARKSSGSGVTKFALGGPVRPRRHGSATSWFAALFSGQMFVSSNHFVASSRFVADPPARRAPYAATSDLQIVLSNH